MRGRYRQMGWLGHSAIPLGLPSHEACREELGRWNRFRRGPGGWRYTERACPLARPLTASCDPTPRLRGARLCLRAPIASQGSAKLRPSSFCAMSRLRLVSPKREVWNPLESVARPNFGRVIPLCPSRSRPKAGCLRLRVRIPTPGFGPGSLQSGLGGSKR